MTEPRDPDVANKEASGSGDAPANSPTDLRTFLIADIRGYTVYTREHGDEAAAALASRFAELVDEVVRTHDGFLVELRGDEALVVFVSARRALRAAIDLQARFKEAQLPRGVGIGLDAGESIPVGTGYRGTALNLAARLCAAAGPGETLASETVIHLAAKVDGISYVDARTMKLKGYSDVVRVVDVVPSAQAKGRRIVSGEGWANRNRGRNVFLAGGAFAALIVVVVVANALGLGPFGPRATEPTPTTVGEPTQQAVAPSVSPTEAATLAPTADPLALDKLPLLAFYDGATGELLTTTPFSSPRNIAFYSAGSFWMLANDPSTWYRVDGETHQVGQPIQVPIVEVSGFNIDDKYLWVTDLSGPQILRIDKATGVPSEFTFAEDETDTAPAGDIAVGDGSVWLARTDREEITRIDAETGEVQVRIPAVAYGLTYGDGALWYWAEGRLGRIDPSTNELSFPEELELGSVGWLGNIYFGGGFAWTAETDAGTLWRVDRSGRASSFALEPGIAEMASTSDTMWVTNANTGELTGVDHVTGQPRHVINTGHATLAVAASGDELMVAVGPTDDEVFAALEGEVLEISNAYVPWFDPAPDPAMNWNWDVRQGLYLTCVHLVNYPDKPAPEGWLLEPEAAEAMPTISDDGRTYAFRIKPGFVFSPPSNEPVTAETFKATIERALDPKFDDGAPGPQFYSDIVGVADYRAGSTDDIVGIVADGEVLTITLEEPSPTFLDRLALSFVCPVPIGTPVLRSGLNPTVPVSGAGPYYVASQMLRRFVILKKNPNYAGLRPQPFDAIAIRMHMTPSTAIDHVQRGAADAAILPPFEPVSGPQSAIALAWGPGSDNAQAGDQRWFGGLRLGIDYLALNPQGGAFSDQDVRRAVALILNRAVINGIFIASSTDDLYLPGMPGAPYPDEPVREPDLDAALALMDGRTFDVTMQGFPEEWGCGECRDFELAVAAQLREIGLDVTFRRGEDHPADAFEPGSGVDMVAVGTGTDIPELVSLIGDLRDNAWLGEENLAELTRLEGLTGDARYDGAVAFVQRLVEDETLVVPFGGQTMPMFLSDDVGCGFVQPAIGAVDLLSLCFEDGT